MMEEQKITPFLMFDGEAEEAMGFYTSIFPDSAVERIERYGRAEPGQEGTVKQAVFRIKGQRFMCIDSSLKHSFGFTPAISFFVTCTDGDEVERCFSMLAADGEILMPLAEYPFSPKFAWVKDRYGVSWQLSLRLATG